MCVKAAGRGSRVNGVRRGFIRTPLTEGADADEAYVAAYTTRIPRGGRCGPAEVAAVFAFLVSNGASFITAECIVVDGGQSTS